MPTLTTKCTCGYDCEATLFMDARPGTNGRGLRIIDGKQSADIIIPEEIAKAIEKAILKYEKRKAIAKV